MNSPKKRRDFLTNSLLASIDNTKSKSQGLSFRNLQSSVKDTYDWWYSNALSDEMRNRFEKYEQSVYFREQTLLEKWKTFIPS